jgi:hypothetical protein
MQPCLIMTMPGWDAGQRSPLSPRKACRAARYSRVYPMSPGAPGTRAMRLTMALVSPPQRLHSGGPVLTSAGAATQALRWALAPSIGGGWPSMHATCSQCLAGHSTWRAVPPTAPGAPMHGCEALHWRARVLHAHHLQHVCGGLQFLDEGNCCCKGTVP